MSKVAKSGYLSGLNNLVVYPMAKKRYADMFGFTEEETKMILETYEFSDKIDVVREWYNGYSSGDGIRLYNPWSIVNFVNEKKFGAYWADTGKS